MERVSKHANIYLSANSNSTPLNDDLKNTWLDSMSTNPTSKPTKIMIHLNFPTMRTNTTITQAQMMKSPNNLMISRVTQNLGLS